MVHDSSSEQPDLEVGLEDCQKVVRELTRALVSTLRALGQTGQAEQASRLAARAYTALRLTDPKTAERINGVMHYLALLPDTSETGTSST